MIPHGSPLRKQYGRALSCREKASFFASKFPTDADLAALNVLPSKPSQTSEYIITYLYLEAGFMLADRLAEVAEKYFVLQKQVLDKKIEITDRNKAFIGISRANVLNNLWALIKSTIEHTQVGNKKIDFVVEWNGANNICRLLMAEIAFTNRRIDDLHGLLNNYETNSSNRIIFIISAIGVVLTFLGVIFAFTGPCSSLFSGLGKEVPPASLDLLKQQIATVQLATANNLSKEEGLSDKVTDITTRLSKVDDRISSLDNINKAHVEALKDQISNEKNISQDRYAAFHSEVEQLRQQVSQIQHALDTDTSQDFQKIQEIQLQINALTISLSKLEKAMTKRELPQINITVPPQDSPKKAIGIINISH